MGRIHLPRGPEVCPEHMVSGKNKRVQRDVQEGLRGPKGEAANLGVLPTVKILVFPELVTTPTSQDNMPEPFTPTLSHPPHYYFLN